MQVTIDIPQSLIDSLNEKEIPTKFHKEIFERYIHNAIGTYSGWGLEKDEFETWVNNNQDDIDDIMNE